MDNNGQIDFIHMQDIDKKFSGVHALNRVSLRMQPGEVRCLAGENGSGKSTLIKVLSGVYKPEGGIITINNNSYRRITPIESMGEGVQIIYQDFSLFPNLTVAENIAMNSLCENKRAFYSVREAKEIAQKALGKIGIDLPLSAVTEELSVADRQLIAIARAMVNDAKLIVMDEATTALTQNEVDKLFSIILDLKSKGIATLFVSHKLREVLEISETITILRNGKLVSEGETKDYDEASISYHMTGRDIAKTRFKPFPAPEHAPPALELQGLGNECDFRNISFTLNPGDIVGITGLLGCGRNELMEALFGLRPYSRGKVLLQGREVKLNSIEAAMENHIGLVPEDRLTEGLFLDQPINDNITVSILDRIKGAFGLLNGAEGKRIVAKQITDMKIVTPDANNPVSSLSGGNQQRVVLGKWLASDIRILMLNGPTVGVDIGSKEEIHKKLKELAGRGLAVLMISDDLPELVQNTSRIILMHKGEIVTEFDCGNSEENDIITKMKELR